MSEGRSASQGRHWHRWRMRELPESVAQVPPPETKVEEPETPRPSEAELRKIREEAWQAGHAEGREAGHQAGFATGHTEGFAQGLEEARAEGRREQQRLIEAELRPLRELAFNLDEALARLDETIAGEVVELALAVGHQLARDSLEAKPEAVLRLVREILLIEPGLSGRPKLRLHPADLSLVREQLGAELEAAGWELHSDDELSRGGCRATSASGEIDASWEERWQSLIRQVRKPRSRRSSEHNGHDGHGESHSSEDSKSAKAPKRGASSENNDSKESKESRESRESKQSKVAEEQHS